MVVRISSGVCSDVTKYRSRAALMGTPGEKMGEALMPRANSLCVILPTLSEVPIIIATNIGDLYEVEYDYSNTCAGACGV